MIIDAKLEFGPYVAIVDESDDKFVLIVTDKVSGLRLKDMMLPKEIFTKDPSTGMVSLAASRKPVSYPK